MNDLITIIIPTYNYGETIARCLDSLINQTYRNLEILIIDDGSTDNTKNICMQYKQRDNRIEYFYQPNAGLSSARNRGVQLATGKYITFIDSDDYLMNNSYLFEMYKQIYTNGLDLAISGYSYVKNNKILSRELLNNYTFIYNYEDIKSDFVRTNALVACHNFLISKALLKMFPFSNELRYSEDFIVMFEIIRKAQKFIYVAITDYAYVQNSKSLTNRNQLEDILRYLADTSFVLKTIAQRDSALIVDAEIRMKEKTNYALKRLSIGKSYMQFKKEYNIVKEKYSIGKYDFAQSRESKINIIRLFLLTYNQTFIYYLLNNIINKIR